MTSKSTKGGESEKEYNAGVSKVQFLAQTAHWIHALYGLASTAKSSIIQFKLLLHQEDQKQFLGRP